MDVKGGGFETFDGGDVIDFADDFLVCQPRFDQHLETILMQSRE